MKYANTPLQLAVGDFKENAAVREHVKLLLNSALGKFNQKDTQIASKFVRTAKDIDNLLKESKEIIDFNDISEHICQVNFRTNFRSNNRRSNPTILAFVTAKARIFLHKKILLLEKHKFRPYYCDTDSILFSGPPTAKIPLNFSLAFGDFKHELGEDSKITRFEGYGRKKFSISYENQEGNQSLMKVCGMTLESHIAQEEFVAAAKRKEKCPKITQIRKIFQKELGLRCPSVQHVTFNNKHLSCERKICKETNDICTEPWGY